MADGELVDTPATAPLSIGIWIESVPDVDLRGEGIARTLAAILRALVARDDTRVVVALAKWSETGFRQLLDDWDVPVERVTILTSRSRDPLAIRLRRRRRDRPRPRRRAVRAVKRSLATAPVRWAVRRMAGVASTPVAVLLASLAALLGIVALPLLAAVALAQAVGRWLVRLTRRFVLVPLTKLGFSASHLRVWLREALIENEFHLLAKRADREARVDVWFVPYPGAAYTGGLSAPIVAAVPDLVYVDFPTRFDAAWARVVDGRARTLLARARAIITYSRGVAERHVAGHLGLPAKIVHVIPHAPFDVVAALDAAAAEMGSDRRVAAPRLIREFLRKRASSEGQDDRRLAYIRDMPFDEITFLFVASQVRPNKNYLNLFRAFERLLRRRHRNIKLVVTGAVARDAALHHYVAEQRLDFDILSVPNLPSPVHASFMHLAALTIVPTLFEGGFPFPFSESLSVGTPVMMSDIAVTREVVPPDLRAVMLFDPYDVERIAERIEWGLDHRAALLDRQRPFHAALCQRTWHDVAGEYRATLAAAARR